MVRYKFQLTSYFLFAFLAINYQILAESVVCLGGLHGPRSKAVLAENEFSRWGIQDSSGKFLPGTVVRYSFIEAPYMEEEEGGITVSPIIDGAGNFPANARLLIRNAFLSWSIVSDITFLEVDERNEIGEIRVGSHPFDEELVLGHGFFPPLPGGSGDGIDGDLHLNPAEDWKSNVEQFFAVALHEIGHNIGLDHIIDSSKTDEIKNIIMFAVIGIQAGPLKDFDQAYAQEIYGPPIPRILQNTNANEDGRQITWTYPFSPFNPQTFDFTSIDPNNVQNPRIPAFEMSFIQCPSSECNGDPNAQPRDIVIANVDSHELQTFEIQSLPLTFTTITDGAEDNETKLFDDQVGDETNGGPVNWEIDDDRDPEDDKAFQVKLADNLPATVSLPLKERVIATATSEWRFRRSYILSVDQRIDYRILDANQQLLQDFSELGQDVNNGSRPLDVPYESGPVNADPATLPAFVGFENGEFIVDLSNFAEKQILVDYSFTSKAFFSSEVIFIDSISLKDVFARAGEFTSDSASIEPGTTTFKINNLPAGRYDLRMRANYENLPTSSIFSPILPVSLQESQVEFKLTFTPADETIDPITLTLGRDDSATINNNDAMFDVEVSDPENTFFYLTNGQSQSGPEKLLKDFRPLTDTTRWEVVFAPVNGSLAGELTWDVAPANPDYLLLLQNLDGENPIGTPVDLVNADSVKNKIALSTAISFEINYAIPQELSGLQLKAGWNLVSVPLVSLQSIETIFGGIKTGSAWFWTGKKFQIAGDNDPLNPERGYWINSEAGGSSNLISGLFSDGLIQLRPQWNLIGPVGDGIPIPENATSVMEWNSEQKSFQRPGQGNLNNGKGYWLFSKSEFATKLSE